MAPVVAYGYGIGLGFDSVTSDHAAGCEELCRWLKSEGYTAAARHRDLASWAPRQGGAGAGAAAAEDSPPKKPISKPHIKRAGESRIRKRKAS